MPLTWALLTEPVEAEVEAARLVYRQSIAGELETRIRAAILISAPPFYGEGHPGPIVGGMMDHAAPFMKKTLEAA